MSLELKAREPIRQWFPLVAPALLLVTLAPLTAIADEVVLIGGSTVKQAIGGRVRGTIESETPTEVVVKVGATSVSVPIDQIVSVSYTGQPASIQLAESREAAGQLAEAAELYKKAAGEAAEKPFVQQMAQFREVSVLADLALVETERAKDAKERLRRFVQAHPSSRHTLAVREDLARLQLGTGDYRGADATIAELAKLPGTAQRAAVLRARVMSREGKNDEALTEIDRLIGTLPPRSLALREARLIKAECFVAAKKFKEAEELLHQVIADAPAEDVAAQSAAYNTLGDCLRMANRPKEALLAYLHTDLLFGKDKQEHPRALHHIERLFRSLKQESRADEYAQRLKQEYPKSQWLNAK